ncbi:serine hydrolase domain-containing protein [Paludisphaera soli]|uniref:serine hydrolase domain-containing protein n=1 Tax=Paludisphaera soli TaxID=2712865 RepID=UPI0013E9EBDF|nr:serine hydrolase domain-containing protein [Paludisphaera soli]
MPDRRDWLKSVLLGGAAGVAGSFVGSAKGQEPIGPGTRRTVRKPVAPTPGRNALRPVLEPWEVRLPDDPQTAAALETVRSRHKLPGMIGAILKGNAVVSIGATGVRKIGDSDPIRVTDLVHLGSCTKAITATLLGTLFEEGLLGASSTIGTVFPEYADGLHPDFRDATLSQLLTHRAGLPHDADWWNLAGRTPTDKRYSALLELCRVAPKTRPGAAYSYSNAGYVLAGLMAEQVTGATWEDLTRARVFERLNMYSGGFGPPGADRSSREDAPYGHHLVRGRIEAIRHDNAEVMGPAGTVHCTMGDWAKFAVAHLRGERPGAKILRPETYRDLHTPRRGETYAGGWMAFDRPWAGGRALNHAGSNTMWYAVVWLAPARDFGVLVVANQGGGTSDQACDEAVGALLGRYEAAFASA